MIQINLKSEDAYDEVQISPTKEDGTKSLLNKSLSIESSSDEEETLLSTFKSNSLKIKNEKNENSQRVSNNEEKSSTGSFNIIKINEKQSNGKKKVPKQSLVQSSLSSKPINRGFPYSESTSPEEEDEIEIDTSNLPKNLSDLKPLSVSIRHYKVVLFGMYFYGILSLIYEWLFLFRIIKILINI